MKILFKMKVIKYILLCIVITTLINCSSDDTNTSFNEKIDNFVYFNLKIDSNNNIIESPEIDNSEIAVATYTKDNFSTMKIPVALHSQSFNEDVTVNFSSEFYNLNNIEIYPENSITFTNKKRVDTIYVHFNERWNTSLAPKIKLTLTNVSDERIALGFPNEEAPNDELTINFSEEAITTTYSLSTNNQELAGNLGEQVLIDINFPNGFIKSEIEDIQLLQEVTSNINYTLERLPIENTKVISYILTLKEDISESLQELKAIFNLATIDNYTLLGSNEISIKKTSLNKSDNAINTAANFYDLSDIYHVTYGETWLYDDIVDKQCEWDFFFALTTPVVVDATHPNAVLYSDGGTDDTSDDIYHHAFRIGFTSFTKVSSNPFNLKRWFKNEAVSISRSPGFQIEEALEFFPENGTSTTKGTVEVINQTLLITNLNYDVYTFKISGSGTYELIDEDKGLFEIIITINLENEELFGGVQSSTNKLYNLDIYQRPTETPNMNCIVPIDL